MCDNKANQIDFHPKHLPNLTWQAVLALLAVPPSGSGHDLPPCGGLQGLPGARRGRASRAGARVGGGVEVEKVHFFDRQRR